MDRFKELTSHINFDEPYNEKDHRAIYNHVESLLDEFPDVSSDTTPPSLVFYNVHNILSPVLIVGQIPDLLNFLSAIETFRRFALLKSDEALEWHKYYEREQSDGRAEDVRLLAANEVYTLRRFLIGKDDQRREYIVLVRNLIQFYIHYLWSAPESCLLAKRLNDFFPGSIQGINKESELLFHIDLSEDEKQYFRQLKVDFCEWKDLVVDWETRREEKYRAEGLSEEDLDTRFADDFHQAFPRSREPSHIARDVQIYINKVEEMVRTLEEWFPPPR